MAKDKISSLTNHLFLTLDRLNDTDISAEELDKEIKRAETITKVSCEIVKVATQTTEITNEQLFAKMCEVQEMLTNPKVEKGLWNIQDVADYCGLSYHHVYSNIITDPRFPDPVDLQGRTDGNAKRLFVKTEVIAFFERYKKKKYLT